MSVTYWIFSEGNADEYTFTRNPDRVGGDSGWVYEMRMTELDIINSSIPTVNVSGFRGGVRNIKYTAITGTMKRTLEDFYRAGTEITNCKDHLYATTGDVFSCIIASFASNLRPLLTAEDTWNVQMTLLRMS